MSIEAENRVLAGMLNDRNFFFDVVSEVHADMFSNSDNRNLFVEISKRDSVKTTILEQEFSGRERAHLKAVDGEWIDGEHSKHALSILKEGYIKRQLFRAIEETKNRMDDKKADQLIADLETEIGKFYFEDKNENIIDPEEYAEQARQEFYDLLIDPDGGKGIPYSITRDNGSYEGFPSLDKTFNGAQGGDLIMLAAKTGHGKTAFAITLSRIFSLYQKYAGYYENAEMRTRELLSRLISPIAEVDANEILNGRLEGTKEEQDYKRKMIDSAFDDYKKSKLYLSRIPSLPLHKAKGLAKQVKNRYKKLDYLIVDYIGRMTIEGRNNMQIWDEMYEITKQLKELAMTLNIPIFMLAQLNHDGNVEGAKKMKNECDGVLYFQPIEESDNSFIEKAFLQEKQELINYKIVKEKVRRDDDPSPIYCNFYKKQQMITEVIK
jgi:replicative DNA helicase